MASEALLLQSGIGVVGRLTRPLHVPYSLGLPYSYTTRTNTRPTSILDILHLIANQNFLLIVAEFTLRSGSHSGFKKKPLTKVQEQDAFLSHTYSRSRPLRSNLNFIRNISLDFKDLRIFLDLHEIVLLPIGFNPGHFL